MSYRFPTLLTDPPWGFLTYGKHRTTPHRCAEDHYETMTLEQMAELPVVDIAAPNAALLMWVVDSHFPEALALGKAWGFEFKTCAFIWVKTAKDGEPRISMGYWTRKQTEQCWLFTRGKPRRKSKGVRQIIQAPRREHSRKPDEIYARAEALLDGPYVELFARQRYPGWSQHFGNQSGLMDVGRVAPPRPVRGPLVDIMEGVGA